MRLIFGSTYLSIHEFPTIDIPDFCLLTGPNGAGKSHLLQALTAGHIRCDLASNPSQEIRLFDFNTLIPQDTGIFSSEMLRNERSSLYTQFQGQLQTMNTLESVRAFVRNMGLSQKYLTRPQDLLSLSDEAFLLEAGEDSEQKLMDLRHTRKGIEDLLMSRFDANAQSTYRSLASFYGKSVAGLSEADFNASTVPSWGQVGVFQQSFARLFVAYRDLQLANDLREFKASKGQNVDFLSRDQFEAVNGPAPWDFVNRSLTSADLDFEINRPDPDDYIAFQPQLRKKSNGINIPFGSLSSGEKILMSFAFCVYYSNDRRQLSSYPKIILLDEVDAPLHPSMSKNLLSTIQNTLVDNFGIKVIATTHSPSTVALAPEEAVYAMRPGVRGIYKTSRAQALNILTVGVPTLAISYDGRRQVFVESPSDAKTYDALYKLLKPRIMSERSLEFVATGTRSAEGEERNTGCQVVKRIVEELVNAGNISVFGLVDWDGKHEKTPRLAVLAQGTRNGLENLVLDPLIILLLIVRQFPKMKSLAGIPEELTFLELINPLDGATIQPLVTGITHKILGSPGSNMHCARYIDGLELNVDERYYLTDDHEVEGKILKVFPFLKEISKNRAGNLMEQIIMTVLTDCPAATPIEILDVLTDLLAKSVE